MSLVIFRTNADHTSGLGHVVRCAAIAAELASRDVECLFVVDRLEPDIAPFLSGAEVRHLYETPQRQIDPEADAGALLAIANELRPDWVVLDDYRMGYEWERVVREAGFRIGVIDDVLRSHCCDLLIDPRWRGEQTRSAYDALIPQTSRRLLGPAYTMLAAEYRQPCPAKREGEPFTIMLGLGGGGDTSRLIAIIDRLLAETANYCRPIQLLPVVGPLASGGELLIERYRDVDAVNPLLGESDLYPYLCRSDLYIGAAGGTLYQLLALGIPALTFSIADNQENDWRLLEEIGHYFHLDSWSDEDEVALPAFVDTVMRHYERIVRLNGDSKCKIDGHGTERIADMLLDGSIAQTPAVSDGEDSKPWQALSPEHRLRPVDDGDINHYLYSRNLADNRRKMPPEKLPRLHHYAWWFGAGRESFLLQKRGRPCLYIWHEKRQWQGREFLFGGWFVCEGQPEFQDALLAQSWQLRHCDEQYPGVPWLAVIHRDNRFVKLMNDYAGFTEIGLDHPYAGAVNSLFPDARHEAFHFVVREAPATATH